MQDPRPRAHDVLGSLISALVGWAAINLLINLVTVFSGHVEALGGLSLLVALVSAIVIFFVWLLALMPLYLWLPFASRLWHWPICTLCGTAAGTGIMYALLYIFSYDHLAFGEEPLSVFLVAFCLGGITGGATCLFGSLTVGYFNPDYLAVSRSTPRLASALRRVVGWFKAKFFELAGQ